MGSKQKQKLVTQQEEINELKRQMAKQRRVIEEIWGVVVICTCRHDVSMRSVNAVYQLLRDLGTSGTKVTEKDSP